MNADVTIEPDDPTPPYEQLRRQLERIIRSGGIPEGARLAPVRRLAENLELAVGTVARAYRELEADGLVVTRRGGGTRVAPGRPPEDVAGRLDALAGEFASAARGLGVEERPALDAVRRAYRA